MGVKINVTDNSPVVIRMKNKATIAALEAIGIAAEKHAKEKCPVDTGRLRNSLTHTVKASENAAYIGTNVEYGKYVETRESLHHNVGQAHFLRDAATTHSDEYKRIAEAQMRNA